MQEIIATLKKDGKYWLSFTGDSITSCEWVHPNWRDIVIYVLQEEVTKLLNGDWKTAEWGIKGFNLAYDGATTKDIYEKLDDILLIKPQMVIGLMGGNDPVSGISVAQSVDYISNIADTITHSGAKLVWSSSTPAGKGSKKNREYEPYARAFMRMPSKDGLTKIDMFKSYQLFPTDKFFTFLSEENPVEGIKTRELDLQHPNQLGNAYIAKVILKEVFRIEFNPDQYIAETLAGEKFPKY
ncbi:MAG: SGNH/GDSL hydrolase family protein [Patescibacteria group bacterium]